MTLLVIFLIINHQYVIMNHFKSISMCKNITTLHFALKMNLVHTLTVHFSALFLVVL